MEKSSNNSQAPVQSVVRALEILECVAASEKPLRSSEIAEAVGLRVTTTSNLLRTLYFKGYLSQTSGRLYRLGVRAACLGDAADQWQVLRGLALPLLRQLSEETGDISFLGVLQDAKLFCVAQTQGTGAVVVNLRQNWLDALLSTASGKVLLAACDEEELSSLFPELFPASEKGDLLRELREIRIRGYSVLNEEGERGIASIGVPVIVDGACMASLAQCFPGYFLRSGEVDPAARAAVLRSFADRISGLLQE